MMGNKWQKVKIKDVGDCITGKTPSTKVLANFNSEDYMFIVPDDITGNPPLITKSRRYISSQGLQSIQTNTIQGKSVLVGCIGSDMGNVAYVDAICSTNQQINSITNFKTEYCAKFIYYQMKLMKNYLRTVAGSTTTPILPKSNFENLEIRVPNLSVQRAIAHILSQLDEKIELNRKINAELENLARTIYIYNFVQNVNTKWKRGKVAELIGATKAGDWGQEVAQGNYTKAVTCIRGADINSVLNIEESKAPVRYILTKNSDKILSDGDFIVEISGGSPTQSTGRMTLITDSILNIFNKPLICSNFCKAFSLKDKSYFYWFYHLWTHLYDCGAFFGFESKTSGIKNFLFDRFVENYEIAVPDGLAIKAFNKQVAPFYDEIIKNRRESIELAALRDFLLPLLMNGQVTVEGIA